VTIDDAYDALNTLLRAVSVPAPATSSYGGTYALADKALVVPCFSLNGPRETWGGQLVSAKDGDRIHAWFFSQLDTQVPGQRRGGQLYGKWVITFYGYLAQRSGSHTDNSDRDFNREANAIELALNADPHSMPTVLRALMLRRDLQLLGRNTCHFAVGDLVIQSC